MRVAGPFGCRCQTIPPCSVSTSRSSNRTGGFPASGSPMGFARRHTKQHDAAPSPPSLDPSAGSESLVEVIDNMVTLLILPPLPDHSQSQAPSLHRRYPVSSVLRACPPPRAARPVPHGRPVEGHEPSPHGASRVACHLHLADMPSPLPRRDRVGGMSFNSTTTAAFPEIPPGRLPHY